MSKDVNDLSVERWNREDDPGAVTPRDCLAALLHDIDSGKKIRSIYVITAVDPVEGSYSGDYDTGHYCAGPDVRSTGQAWRFLQSACLDAIHTLIAKAGED